MKEHDLNIAEMKAGQLQMQSEVQAMRTDITQNFASLRRDMGLGQGQAAAPRHQQPYRDPNQPRPQVYGQRQPRQPNYPVHYNKPRLVDGLTDGAKFGNNRPPQVLGQPRNELGAITYENLPATTPKTTYAEIQNEGSETPPPTQPPPMWSNPNLEIGAASYDMGHGWVTAPGSEIPEGYEEQPQGVHPFDSSPFETSFR